ncbi:SRPBCC family protein [Leifsonia shinshuensis]|uniref:SRPBCC domain-containing protein n=1 Tax=Leifsonia shinshuensis TaxID=150026 RepID=A0A7G6YBN3_9MICO|nr:SRPBCC domain-containing protein [Leifsonia shinshuensis]QNE35898.1 SRPBCC domain-containing protein [Leifsonia shinshuensis]
MTNETTDIVVRRILNAPVETVWRLWTDPELVTEWWGPQDYTSPSAQVDLREGGSYVFSMLAPDDQGGAESFTGGVYTAIVPHERLEFTQSITDEDGVPLPGDQLPEGFTQNIRTVVEFADVNGLTELTITESGWSRSLMSVFAYAGMHQSLDKLTTDVLRAMTETAA